MLWSNEDEPCKSRKCGPVESLYPASTRPRRHIDEALERLNSKQPPFQVRIGTHIDAGITRAVYIGVAGYVRDGWLVRFEPVASGQARIQEFQRAQGAIARFIEVAGASPQHNAAREPRTVLDLVG